MELNGCPITPGSPARSTGSGCRRSRRPFEPHTYLPTVYWELQGLESLFRQPDLDHTHPLGRPRRNHLLMWSRSVQCYTTGLSRLGLDDSTRLRQARHGRNPTTAKRTRRTPRASDAWARITVHHNEAGGWMMADVWYSRDASVSADPPRPPPSRRSDAEAGQAQMRVTAFDRFTQGLVTVSYAAACRATRPCRPLRSARGRVLLRDSISDAVRVRHLGHGPT
jgi:hypothetical protein